MALERRRIDPRYSLQIQYDKVIYESRSVWGYKRVLLPIASISSLHFGYSKPWRLSALILVLLGTAGYFAMKFREPGWAVFLWLAGTIGAVTQHAPIAHRLCAWLSMRLAGIALRLSRQCPTP